MRRFLPYAQLVRLPNVFTAFADIVLGALATASLPGQWQRFVLLLLASGCLYCGGMVWNDYFDLEQDSRERPFRPLPSGKVSRAQAVLLGVVLLLLGVGCAVLADWDGGRFRWNSSVLAGLLVVAILLYDGVLKRTAAGPFCMGACRFLNVLLGLSVLPEGVGAWGLPLALVVGVYIVGVTWFARTEAAESSQGALGAAAAVMLAALLIALLVPIVRTPMSVGPEVTVSGPIAVGHVLFPYLLVAFGLYVGFPVCAAISRPTPAQVQAAVKRSVLGLVALDAVLATVLAGPLGLALLLLLLPALYLGRWVYST